MKLGKCGEGQPGREPVISEETRRELMLKAYRRQEELKVSGKSNVFSIYFPFYLYKKHILSVFFHCGFVAKRFTTQSKASTVRYLLGALQMSILQGDMLDFLIKLCPKVRLSHAPF